MEPIIEENMGKKVLVPRKARHNVHDMLANGVEGIPAEEAASSNMAFFCFLVVMFIFSFEVFIRLARVDKGDSSPKSEF